MPEIKCVMNDGKTGKSYQKVSADDSFVGRKIGDKVPGNLLGLTGYELKITGGSDSAGFPMRQDIEGGGRKKLLMNKGVGIKQGKDFLRKTVRGNTINAFTMQVNMKIINYGSKSVEELLGIQPKEEKKEEAKAPEVAANAK